MTNQILNVDSRAEYPASALSNFAHHEFIMDGVKCRSIESWLQSLKKHLPDIQAYICGLSSMDARKAVENEKWWRSGFLYWKGETYVRAGEAYQDLLDRVYNELYGNQKFREALRLTEGKQLTHKIGKISTRVTVLTRNEFTSRLEKMRIRLIEEDGQYSQI